MDTTSNPRRYPLTRGSARLAHFGLWLFGLLAAVSVFSLLREGLSPSWPMLRAVAHAAVLGVSFGLFAATALVLRRHKDALAARTNASPRPTAAGTHKPRRASGRPVFH
jgi:hypothetical protein